ncbi:hypothetical protein VCUG_00622 [Vavraia culicis subsp. floridensis]|uniref:Uncharacterized protein n=1 Tax=Vavraia culicis (isolate floridensis) TaxID=948595 RepID=L2GX44_VAVCU|nr:uncharacterized protein VCUG_00622 [Vavraia culicis subsp. floridensis]ELA47902.1 hypothetical protein VCUG_00622 [Vavraia culicis subsp. floridensis]
MIGTKFITTLIYQLKSINREKTHHTMLFTLLIPHISAEAAPYVRTISDAILVEPVPNQSFDMDLHGNPDRSYYGTMKCDDVMMPISGSMGDGYGSYAPAAASYAAPAAASYAAPAMASYAAPAMASYAPTGGSHYAAESMPVAQPFFIADQGMSGAIMQGQGQGQAGAATGGAGGAAAGTGKSEGGAGKSSGLKDEKSGDKKGNSKSSTKKSSKSSSKTKSSNGAASISIMSALLGVALCVILV